MNIHTSVKQINGVGEERAKKLEKLGITTVRDLLYLFPRTYEIRGDVKTLAKSEIGQTVSLILTVGTEVTFTKTKKNLSMYSFRAYDETGSVQILFFQSPFVKQIFKTGLPFRFYGKITWYGKTLAMTSPKYEPYIPGIPLPYYHPVYPLTAGLTSKIVSGIIANAMSANQSEIRDPLPEEIRLSYQLPTLGYALQNVHFPLDKDALSTAIKRLAFDELFEFALLIAKVSQQQKSTPGAKINSPDFSDLRALLPFSLTDGQNKAIDEIITDMTEQRKGAMNRILIGDVGSGKTICAIFAAYATIQSGKQVVFMAPTEILARQHFENIRKLFDKLHINSELLLGSTKKSDKTKIANALQNGTLPFVVGTHALLNEAINYHSLGLIITDEQHRFGIQQRAFLKSHNESAHILVMSATPIPRSLALAIYGDLNVSRIHEMPKGRQRVDTFVVDESYRQRLNSFIDKQIQLGGQCYIVCPGIEEETKDDEEKSYSADDILSSCEQPEFSSIKAVLPYSQELKKTFPIHTVGVLHGKMKAAEKERIINDFQNGNIQILVSTTIIEVGVDNPNATLIIVENADRFGLSQLHQLRGRVGRSDKKSYCVLVSDSQTENGKERLSIMKTVYDGFVIAEKDLMMRGPGNFFSSNSQDIVKQSGVLHFHFAALQKDEQFMERVFVTAKGLIQNDPDLSSPSHLALRSYVLPYVQNNLSTIS